MRVRLCYLRPASLYRKNLMAKSRKASSVMAALRKYAVKRDNYTCQVCHVYFDKGTGLDMSHHIPRWKGSTKYEPDNVSMKCRACHQYMDTHPLAHTEWIKEWLGEERYEALKEKERDLWSAKGRDFAELCEKLHEMRKEL